MSARSPRAGDGSGSSTSTGSARASVRGIGPPLLMITGHRGQPRPVPSRSRPRLTPDGVQTFTVDAPGTGESTAYRCRAACVGWPAPWTRCSTRSATTRSTCSASRSAASSPSSWPTRHHSGCAGSCSPRPAPASAASRARRGSAGPGHAAALYQPDYYRRVAGRIYGGAARPDPDALLRGRSPGSPSRPSMGATSPSSTRSAGWTSLPWLWRLRQPTLVLAGDDDPIVPLVNGRILARLHPRRPPPRRLRRRPPVPP